MWNSLVRAAGTVLVLAGIIALIAGITLRDHSNVAAGVTIQELVDQATPGSTVRIPAGEYHELVTIHKPITLSAEPGAVIIGDDRPHWIIVAAHDVTVEGFEMRGTVNQNYWGGITQHTGDRASDRLTVQNNILIGASYAAIATKEGTGHRILNNVIRDSGALGIRIDSGSDHLIAGNTIFHTNMEERFDPGWEAGGIKISGNFGGAHNIIVERNDIHHNRGHGVWADVDSNDVTIRHNQMHHNARAGITYEISFNGTIHHNVIWKNGYLYREWGWGAGIVIQNSSGVDVHNNIVAWNADGISVVSQHRAHDRWNAVRDIHVHDNTIVLAHDGSYNTYALGWLEDWSGPLTNPASNNYGWGNRYWLPTDDGSDLRFRWASEYFFTLDEFMSTSGERDAGYLTVDEKNARLISANIPVEHVEHDE